MSYPDRANNPARKVNPLQQYAQQVSIAKHRAGTNAIKAVDSQINKAEKTAKNKSNPVGLRMVASDAASVGKAYKAKLSDKVYNTGTFFQEKINQPSAGNFIKSILKGN